MEVFEAVEQIGQIAEQARVRRAQSFPLSPEFVREKERWLLGYVCRWETLCRGTLDDGTPCWNVMNRMSLDPDDLEAAVQNEEIRFVTSHIPGSDWGWWGSFTNDIDGLIGLGIPDDGPAFRELLGAFHEGRATHLSFHATVFRSKERTRPGPDGLPVFDIIEARLVEAGPTDDPADDLAEILEIGGREPEWRSMVHRVKMLRDLRPPPALVR